MTITNYSMTDYAEEKAFIETAPSLADEKSAADAKAAEEAKWYAEEQEERKWREEAETTLSEMLKVINRLIGQLNENPDRETAMVYDAFVSSHSDLYKEVHWVRPHGAGFDELNAKARDFLASEWEWTKTHWDEYLEQQDTATRKWMDEENARIAERKAAEQAA